VKKSTAYKLWTRWGHWDELKRKIKSCPLKKQWFVTLTYNKHHRITDISHESARNHLVGFGRYLARKTKSHIELYAVYGDNHSPSNSGSEPEPHIHLILSSDVKIELWQIIDAWKQPPSPEQIKRKKEQGDVDPYGLVSRGWVEADEYDYTKEDECLTYLYAGHSVAERIPTNLFCGVRSHRNNCRGIRESRHRRILRENLVNEICF
jgi:hypothetical protein